ncbi:MAG: hypothetical protein HY272_09175 [Gammaproteobacteria bacterium]|nr:hypothetical protein [Gammaproteobacteria bacterium]
MAPLVGYTNQLSYQAGDTIAFHISSKFQRFQITIQRFGIERQTVLTKEVTNGQPHAIPENASSHGANWPQTLTVTVPESWRSGYYQVFLGVSDPADSSKWIEGQSMFFVIRAAHPGKEANILYQMATNTYNAYNNWGGNSLYEFNSASVKETNRVSFLRPIPSDAYRWDLPFIEWAEKNGYRMDYAINSDFERNPDLIKHYKLVLSVGHDEYWSAGMRDQLEAFIANGGNVAFFGGNNITWQIRYEADAQEMVIWRAYYRDDPLYRPEGPNPTLATLWSHPLIGRPENQLSGVGMRFGGMHRNHGQFMDGTGAFTVHRPEHWVFAKTGLKEGQQFGGKDSIVGYECDGCEITWVDGRPQPTHRDGTPENFEVLATAPAQWPDDAWPWFKEWQPGRIGNACFGIYKKPGGGTVFTASTTNWSHGLKGHDPIVEQISRNVMDRLSKD